MKPFCAVIAMVALGLAGGQAFAQEAVSAGGHFADLNGARIYYEDHGSGEPLLLLHHFGSTASPWKTYIDDWAPRYRVIAWDMRGHGRSTNPASTDAFLHTEAARDLLALMDSLGIGRARAIGASSGGMTLLHAATMAPERFEALVLVGAQIYYSEAVRRWIVTSGPWEQDPERMRRFTQLHGQARGLQLAQQFWRFRNLYDDPAFTPDKLATISARTLIVHGDNDFVPITQALEMYHSIPSARLWIVPNGGHLPYLAQDNHVDFVRRVTEFLEGKWDTQLSRAAQR